MGLALHVPQRAPGGRYCRQCAEHQLRRQPSDAVRCPPARRCSCTWSPTTSIHTFYVPEFLFQRDMIPGINNTVDFNLIETGSFYGECNNICGEYHAYMRFMVDVLSPAALPRLVREAGALLDHHRGPASAPTGLTPGAPLPDLAEHRKFRAGSDPDTEDSRPKSTWLTPSRSLMEIVPGPRPRGPGQVHHQHRPQADRPQLPGHVVHRVPVRGPAGRGDPHPADRPQQQLRDRERLQPAVHHARHDHAVRVPRAVRLRRPGQLPDPADDRGAGHGVPPLQQPLLLAVPRRASCSCRPGF